MRIGIDVGGTNTDAVLMDGDRVLAWHKIGHHRRRGRRHRRRRCSHVLDAGTAYCGRRAGGDDRHHPLHQRGRRAAAAARRSRRSGSGCPRPQSLPPMVDWPADLRAAIGGHSLLRPRRLRVRRRRDLAGRRGRDPRLLAGQVARPRAPLGGDLLGLLARQRRARAARRRDPRARNSRACAVASRSEIGRIGLLERENATILNACLRRPGRSASSPSFRTRAGRAGHRARRSTSARTTAR